MGKAEMQAEIDSLKQQLATEKRNLVDAQRASANWRHVADTRLTDLNNQSQTIRTYQKEMAAQKLDHQAKLIQATERVAAMGLQALEQVQHKAEVAIVTAERNAVANAFRYTIDNLTLNK